MLITRISIVSGVERAIDLPITEEQMAAYAAGSLVQNAFPHLTADQREFIISGITAEEWDETFAEDDDEDEVEKHRRDHATIKIDIESYTKFLISGDHAACLAIEKRYGLDGMSPEQVNEYLGMLSERKDEDAF